MKQVTNHRLALLIAVATGCAGAGSDGRTAPQGTMLVDKLATANAAHQPLVAEFGAAWCKPCHDFADHVVPDPRVQAALAGVVFVQYDIDTAQGSDAAKRCNVTNVPAVVAIAPDGTPRPFAAGREPTIDEFIAFLEHAKSAN